MVELAGKKFGIVTLISIMLIIGSMLPFKGNGSRYINGEFKDVPDHIVVELELCITLF